MKPFFPKSTTHLKPGHFWSLPISDDRFGCGIVLSLRVSSERKRDSRIFLAGLVDWTGDSPPDDQSICDRRIIATRFAHIKAIQTTGRDIIGQVIPWWEWPSEIFDRDDIPTAGYNVLRLLAEKHAHSSN